VRVRIFHSLTHSANINTTIRAALSYDCRRGLVYDCDTATERIRPGPWSDAVCSRPSFWSCELPQRRRPPTELCRPVGLYVSNIERSRLCRAQLHKFLVALFSVASCRPFGLLQNMIWILAGSCPSAFWSRYDLDFWLVTLKHFSIISTHVTIICCKFHWNLSIARRDIASREIDLRTDGRMDDPKTKASRRLFSAAEGKNKIILLKST